MLANVTLVLAIVTGLVVHAAARGRSSHLWMPAAALLLLATAGVAGATASDGPPAVRRVSSLISMNRATSIALLAVGGSFAGQPAPFNAVVTFGILQTVTAMGIAVLWRRGVAVLPAAGSPGAAVDAP